MNRATDYGTYRQERIRLLGRIKRAGQDYSRTKLEVFLNDLHALREKLAALDRANPTNLRLFLQGRQQVQATRQEFQLVQNAFDPDFYDEPSRPLDAA